MLFKYKNISIILFVIILVLLEVLFRSAGVPIVIGDANFFYPIAQNFAEHNDLSHPVMSPIVDGGGRLIWHGWGHSYVLGFLGKLFSDSFIGVIMSETLIVGIGCIGFTITFCSAYKKANVYVKGAIVISVVAIAFGYLGRPESLSFVLLVAGIAAFHYLENSAFRWGVIVVLWGGIGTTQPTVALLVGPILLGYMVISEVEVRLALSKWLVVGAFSIATTLLLTAVFYPYSVADWIDGLWRHSQKIAARGDSDRTLYYYFLAPSRFMQGGWYALTVACGGLLLWQSGETRNWTLVGVALIGAGLAWYTSIRIPPTNYNLFALLPVFAIIVQESLTKIDSVVAARVIKAAVLILGLSSTLIVGRSTIVSVQSSNGPSRQNVVNKLNELIGSQGEVERKSICMNKGILFSVYEPSEWDSFCSMNSKLPTGKEEYAVTMQAGLGRFKPPEVENYTVLFDNFRNNGIHFGPLKVANTDDSYRFAVYKRK